MNLFVRTTVLGIVSVAVLGVAPASGQLFLEADSLFRAQDWEGAAMAYQQVTDQGSTSGQAWFRLGYALRKIGQYQRAVAALERADSLGFARSVTRYNTASAFALLGDRERAFQWLGGALDAGFRAVETLRNDEDLASLRDDPRFELVVERADRAARPCAYDAHYSEFDFWVGEWEVYTPQGQLAGTNTITKIENGCLVTENWLAVNGGTGKSINYYDPAAGTWRQVWVDFTGGILELEGELKDGAMRFVGTHTYMDGRQEAYRMVFTPRPDGSVRQFIEQSRDNGQSWYTSFEGIYVKAN